jgi:hypothetical protein
LQIVRLQQHIRAIERAEEGRPAGESLDGPPNGLPRAERRRLEREQNRRRRRSL